MSDVNLVHVTPDAEALIAKIARVSSKNENNPEYEGLLKYLITHKHWSPFEMASMCLEIETSRAISTQILRHRSFYFQEFSQRYQTVLSNTAVEARLQDSKNRQNSIRDGAEEHDKWFAIAQYEVWNTSKSLYEEALKRGIAKEQARFLLPLSTQTRLYMHGTVRSWIHYIELRAANGTQKEHADIALAAKEIFKSQFPTISSALGWV